MDRDRAIDLWFEELKKRREGETNDQYEDRLLESIKKKLREARK